MNGRLVCGVGINDANYVVNPVIDGKQVFCPFYITWSDMLTRCYSKKYQQRRPTYIGCSVCEEWLTFSNFKAWTEGQDWQGKQLDKDLLDSGNKQYNPESCIFILRSLNMLLVDCAAKRGDYPLGVSWHKRCNKFVSQIVVNGKQKHIGLFTTPEEAHKAWQQAKLKLIFLVSQEQIDERLKAALLLRCDGLQYAINNNLETIKL